MNNNHVSGAISSGFSSAAGALNVGNVAMIGVGGLSGGVGAWATGGNFWDGMRQGLITAGLNHAANHAAEGLANANSKPPTFLVDERGIPYGIEKDGVYYSLPESLKEKYMIEADKLSNALYYKTGAFIIAFGAAGAGVYFSSGIATPLAKWAMGATALAYANEVVYENAQFKTSIRSIANEIDLKQLRVSKNINLEKPTYAPAPVHRISGGNKW